MSLGQNINLLNLSFSNNSKPLTYFNDNNKFPSTSFLSNDKTKINKMLNNTLLKRACCMRNNNTDDDKNIVLQNYDENNNVIETSYTVNELNKYCKNLDYVDNGGVVKGEFKPQSKTCDNFYYTYCKTLTSLNQDYLEDKNYNQYIKYSNINDSNTGNECSCINSPILNKVSENNLFTEDNIYHLDKYCNNDGVYLTDKIKNSTNKSINYNICESNIGTNMNDITNLKQSFEGNINTNCNISSGTSSTDKLPTGTNTFSTTLNNTPPLTNTKSNNTSSNDTKSNDTKSNDTSSNDTSSNDTKSISEINKKYEEDKKKEEEAKTLILGLKQNEFIGLLVLLIIFIVIIFFVFFKNNNTRR